jgi:glycosyltransferase involved in cell wall biosynthesis
LRKVQEQSVTDVEVVLVDNGSRDRTVERALAVMPDNPNLLRDDVQLFADFLANLGELTSARTVFLVFGDVVHFLNTFQMSGDRLSPFLFSSMSGNFLKFFDGPGLVLGLL